MFEYTLNKAQKQAVEHTDGPLLIVAGAGTGKTTVITSKIAYLVEKGLAKPEEILALAFNEKAAQEMQERVDNMINASYSELTIATFHAFCQRVLERHALDIGLSPQFKLLTESGAWLLVRKHLSKFDLDYYRPMGNPMKHIHELLRHFSKCKDELISPEEYLEHAESLKLNTDAAFGKTPKKAKTPNNGATEQWNNDDEIKRLVEISNAYHVYNRILLDNASLDFGDLIYYAVKLLENRPNVLQKFHKKYKYILVDEFQDVNWAQYRLVQLLTGPETQLTVVGDDDQSIYAFRGASVSNILRFKDDYPEAQEVVLNENYRSNQSILDLAYTSIQNNNPDRLEVKLKIDKKLKSPDKKKTKEAVVHLHAPTLDEEVQSVIDEIRRIKTIDETVTWDDFAILVRANAHAEPFMNRLEVHQIPYEFVTSTGLYRQPIVLDCLNFFKIIDNYHESSAIFRLLSLPFLHLRESDLQKITSSAKKKSISYYEALKRVAEFDISQEGIKIANELIEAIHEGMRRIRHEKPSTILYAFLEKIGYLNYLTKQEGEGNKEVIRQIYHLKQFFEYISEFETLAAGNRVSDFLEHFALVVESGDKGSLYTPSDTPDSVNILTVHASKGLEFKYVFIVNLVEERFPTRTKGDGIEVPIELIKESLPEGDSHYQEERRLFYVAVTRAKEHLYFTSAADYGGARNKKLSRFLAELNFSIPEAPKKKDALKLTPKVETTHEKGSFVFELPKAFSFSQVRSYETCPYQYKLAHILHIPMKGSAAFSFGQTMHSTLQTFYTRIQELNAAQQVSLFAPFESKGGVVTATAVTAGIKVPTLEDLIKIYEAAWLSDWYASQSQREEYYEKGKEILKVFYKTHENNWTIPVNLESWFKIKVGDYFMHGRIDRIDQLPDGTLEIIDYKTGKSKDKLTGDDKEQLLIYQIAAEELPEYSHIGKTSKLTFYYLNDGVKTSFVGENKELGKLKEKLSGIISRIHSLDFNATPSQFACERCDFRDICDFRA